MQALLDEVRERFGVSASDGLQLLSVGALVARPFDPGMAVVVVPESPASAPAEGALESALPGRAAHAESPVAMLRALYPAAHPVHVLGDGGPSSTVGDLTEDALAAHAHYLPAVSPLDNLASPYALPWLVARLRAPDGCPWDREQTHQSLAKFLLEETYEVYDALDDGSTPQLAEELGDLLLQVILHAHYAAEDGVFDMTDVHREVMTKIVRRHPHVFGDVVADSSAEVIRNWEQIKAGERAQRSADNGESAPRDRAMPEAFAGLSRSLPALAYAQEMQERAASLGYDWPTVEGVLEKVREESAEIAAATDAANQREEFGDLMLVLVNLARKLDIDAEGALRASSAKFAARFAHVERLADERNTALRDMTFEQLDELWEKAKMETRVAAQ
jgi:tetrapyrrole methylase family protein/MazG family protein